MGCKTTGSLCDGFNFDGNRCYPYVVNDGATFDFREYPPYPIRNSNYNIPNKEANAIMYPYITYTNNPRFGGSGVPPASSGNCGKIQRTSPCYSNTTIINDYYPTELSFDHMLSDTWISFLYDTTANAGVSGTPCFHIETRTDSTTTSGSTSSTSSTICHPCTNFYCTPAETTIRYTVAEDLTGDPDCPHPTLFGIGTTSNKIVFEYDQLSTTVPDGVIDFEFSYDGVTYTDIWDEGLLAGIAYDSPQNPWQSGDEGWSDFEIFELEDANNNKLDFRIKVYIQPIFDDSGASTVFSGTRWTVAELMNAGTNYVVNDTFQLSYTHTHPDNSTTNLTMNLKITEVGPLTSVASQNNFDLLRSGDVVNGHTITRVFHTDVDNFAYHVAYLDGSGSNFSKDGQYTSNRNHQITTKAGLGIAERACLIGLYEFLNKSVQFVTADIDKNAPDIFNQIKQPEFDVTVTNGRVSAISITDGGEGWNKLGNPPQLEVTPPADQTGNAAVVEGIFTNGVLTSITIVDGGSKYDANNAPSVYIRNVFRNLTDTTENDGYRNDGSADFKNILKALPKSDDYSLSSDQINAVGDAYDATPESLVNQTVSPTTRIKADPERNAVYEVPQYLYSEDAVKEVASYNEPGYDLNYLNDTPIDVATKELILKEKNDDRDRRNAYTDALTQYRIPDFVIYDESKVETVQGSLTNLPYSSTYTKYILRQYRADPAISTTIDVTLSCSPVDTGCSHFTCTAPGVTAGSTSSSTDPETGVTTTTTRSYTMSGLLGSGCQSWSASGRMLMLHDMTGAANTAKRASEAYGNPYS